MATQAEVRFFLGYPQDPLYLALLFLANMLTVPDVISTGSTQR